MSCTPEKLSNNEISRYSRQIRLSEIGEEGQKKIKGSSILVVGAGALGCPVLQYLTAAGVGTLGIMDNDWVDISNLNRQILYTTKDIGKPKPLAAREKLKLQNSDVKHKIHFLKLDSESALKVMCEYDIIVDCTDNFATRYLISDASVILNKPVVYGAIHKFTGQIMVLNYRNGPTLRCLHPDPPHPLMIPSCEEFGVIGSVPGIIGSLQATEVLKIILELDGILSGKIFMIDTLNYHTWISTFERNIAVAGITKLGIYEDNSLSDANSVKEISITTLKNMMDEDPGLIVIDLRDRNDNEDIGVQTMSIPYYDVTKKLNYFTGKNAVVFYCRSGSRSTSVINYLQKEYNLSNLYSLAI